MAESIDAYIADFPDEVQPVLEKIRTIIRKAAPDAEETISYRIPTFKLNGTYLVYFAGLKNHVSLYPILGKSPGLDEEIAPYRSGRGTVKFPLDRPIPYQLIAKIVEFMARENARRTLEKLKRKGKKK